MIVKDRGDLFEELVKKFPKLKPAFIAETLTGTLLELKRKYQIEVDKLTPIHFHELFKHLAQEKIHKDIVLDVLIDMAKGVFELSKYVSLSSEEIYQKIKTIVEKNKDVPFGALMGQCVKQLNGKASGQVISAELKKILNEENK